MDKKTFRYILKTFVIWQLLVAIIVILGIKYFPTTGEYLYTEKQLLNPSWLWSRANFNGIHYLDIARRGYGIHQQDLFPLYPKLIRFLTPYFGGRDLIIGLTISWVFFFLALFLFYKLVRLDWKKKVAKRAIFSLLIFPTAFFFSMVYTESLFLFLVLAAFYFARTKRWWLAGIFGALASATRLPGIFLFPALAVELYGQHKERKITNCSLSRPYRGSSILSGLITSIPLFFIPLGLLYYMRFLAMNYNDPLMFIHVQPYFGAGGTGGRLILLYQVFWRYLKMLISVKKFSCTYFVCLLESFTGITFLFLTIFVYLRRWFSYATFMILAYITPTLTGTFSSLPRYALILFPGFILLALWTEKYQWVRIIYTIACGVLLIVSLVLFSRGFWIA